MWSQNNAKLNDSSVDQGCQTRGPRMRFVQLAILFQNFQIINVYVISFDSARLASEEVAF